MNTPSQEFRELHEKPKRYIVVVGPSSSNDSTFAFGPFDEDEADECAYQIERDALEGSDRDIKVTTLYVGLARWYGYPKPGDPCPVDIERLVEIEP